MLRSGSASHPRTLSAEELEVLKRFCFRLIDQQEARVIVAPQVPVPGYWFGGGNMVESADGTLYLVGRFRNAGDSRTGVQAGTRGLELVVFRSSDRGQTFEKMFSFSKERLSFSGRTVISIEGACLNLHSAGVALFVSTEKDLPEYPSEVAAYQKAGAGVWSIDVLRANSIDELAGAVVEPFLESRDPEHLHVKDPFLIPLRGREQELPESSQQLGFCSHPFNWTSSNTGSVGISDTAELTGEVQYGVFPRGCTWDVAMSRVTCVVPVPRVGRFERRELMLAFYCGGECVRPLDEHQSAVSRPRGYSCEELGGVAVIEGGDFRNAIRLSQLFPMFVSPWGTGCSRYVDVLPLREGYLATWQQSAVDGSQPLVAHLLPSDAILRHLSYS